MYSNFNSSQDISFGFLSQQNFLAKNCDFFAIGTNDLTMYTLAIDRGDEEVAKIYDPGHLSVLKLIDMSARSARKNKIPISICGEMAGDTLFTSVLIGMKSLLISTGNEVLAGEPIAKISPNIKSQLYFELRENGKIIDPKSKVEIL